MPFLYEKIDTLREVGVLKELPQYIPDNLNPNFELRPYQIAAFENFITYFESDKLCQKPTQTLFHMATGSGKTLIMAGLMLYLYKQGYRNFLFFVNKTNPYRAVFAVDKLNEGWDVLNLFDIVRLYETRDGKNGIPGKTTMKEAQLIGRGARYCPFKITEEQEKYQRKYDNDIDNPLRICEELYYHCWNEPRYISELHTALREIGIDLDKTVTRNYVLKDEFKEDDIYKSGYVFVNERLLKSRNEVVGLLPSVRDKIFNISIATGRSGEDIIMEDNSSQDSNPNTYTYRTTIGDIADINYAIVYKALCKYSVFKFNVLKSYFPNLKSTKEFVYDKNYLGYIRLHITSKYEMPTADILYSACVKTLGNIAESISGIEETYEGSSEFTARYIHPFTTGLRESP